MTNLKKPDWDDAATLAGYNHDTECWDLGGNVVSICVDTTGMPMETAAWVKPMATLCKQALETFIHKNVLYGNSILSDEVDPITGRPLHAACLSRLSEKLRRYSNGGAKAGDNEQPLLDALNYLMMQVLIDANWPQPAAPQEAAEPPKPTPTEVDELHILRMTAERLKQDYYEQKERADKAEKVLKYVKDIDACTLRRAEADAAFEEGFGYPPPKRNHDAPPAK